MKIFSLETKTNLVGWSLVLGILISGLVACVFHQQAVFFDGGSTSNLFGAPFEWSIFHHQELLKTHYYSYSLVGLFYNILFWGLVVFIFLSLVRYFRKKNNKITSKV
jgi:hypothetical protein